MIRWLRGPAVTKDGHVLSWTNELHPGYAYPEAAGLWLGLFAAEGAPGELEARVARALVSGMEKDGSVGRRGFQYAFDTAVALRGLIAYEQAGGRVEEPEALTRMFGFIADSVEARRAVIPEISEERWSTRFSPHMMKLVIVCSEWKAKSGDARTDAVFAALHRELLPRAIDWLDGSAPRYSHSVCYATEAMLHLAKSGVPGSAEGAAQAARWLAGIQTPEGGVPAWSLPGPETRLASDATAQAICIWDAVDRERYAGEIENAFSHLARMQHPSGGIRYSEHRDDVNSWCTIFTLDALRVAKPWT